MFCDLCRICGQMGPISGNALGPPFFCPQGPCRLKCPIALHVSGITGYHAISPPPPKKKNLSTTAQEKRTNFDDFKAGLKTRDRKTWVPLHAHLEALERIAIGVPTKFAEKSNKQNKILPKSFLQSNPPKHCTIQDNPHRLFCRTLPFAKLSWIVFFVLSVFFCR